MTGRDWMQTPGDALDGAGARTPWIAGILCVPVWFFAAVGFGSRAAGGAARMSRDLVEALVLVPDRVLSGEGLWTLFTWPVLHDPRSLGHLVIGLALFAIFARRMERARGLRPTLVATALVVPLLGGAHVLLSHLLGFPGVALGGALQPAFFHLGWTAARDPDRSFLLFGHVPWTLRRTALVFGLSAGLLAYALSPSPVVFALAGFAFALGAVLPLGPRQARAVAPSAPPGRRPAEGKPAQEAADSDATRLDEILARISRDGIDALSQAEREFLEAASARRRARERER